MKTKPFLSLLAGSLLASTALAAEDALVTTAWAEKNLNHDEVRVVEVSVEPGVYERGHLPGAAQVRWHTDLVDTVRRDIVSREEFEALASRLGITPETTVLLYGDKNNWFAAWAAWVFTLYGHEDVRLIDGGRKKWEAEGRPLSQRPFRAQPTDYEVTEVREDLRAGLPEVVAVAEGDREGSLVDIRSAEEYSGRIIAPAGVAELAVRGGHVPGAVNVPWGRAVDPETGAFLPKEELRALYAAEGIDGSEPVITYCRIGERSSHTWFALHHLLGYEVANYDGSWTEYGNSVGVPIENPSGSVWTGQ